MGIDAQLAIGGSISGTLTDANGDPVGAVDVTVDGPMFRFAVTSPDGSYHINGLSAGSYTVQFDDVEDRYLTEWYDNTYFVESATPVAVADGEAVVGIDAQLSAGGSISGTVTDANGDPVVGGTIEVLVSGPTSRVTVALGGSYVIGPLIPGSYTVAFNDFEGRYAPEWYDDANNAESATPVVVADGEAVVGIDAQLSTGGSISGTVTDGAGDPLAGVYVSLGPSYAAAAVTGADGSYQIGALAAGSYTVRFEGDIGYFTEWFDDAPDEASATPVVVGRDQVVSGIDAQLFDGAAISGTVTDEDGDPLEGITVSVRGPTRRSAITGPNGFYRLAGLTSGKYIVQFEDSDDRYVAEYFDDADRKSKATPVYLDDGEVVIGG